MEVVDQYISDSKKWSKELAALRAIALETLLEEQYKWQCPCYSFKGKNVVLLHEFKDYCAILFFKGALLLDQAKVLTQQTEKVQAARQWRFTDVKQILKQEKLIKAYIHEAIEIEKAGLKVTFKSKEEYVVPEELTEVFKRDKELKKAFEVLTPGRQKAYLLHFSSAKQTTTRFSRIENCKPRILKGKGLTDCICGLSKRKPNCDGSHKLLKK